MVSTHCHFLQKAAWGRARASSYCTYSFFIVARYAIPVARYAIPVARDAISVSREGGNLLLSGTVLFRKWAQDIGQHSHALLTEWKLVAKQIGRKVKHFVGQQMVYHYFQRNKRGLYMYNPDLQFCKYSVAIWKVSLSSFTCWLPEK